MCAFIHAYSQYSLFELITDLSLSLMEANHTEPLLFHSKFKLL